MNDTWRDRLEFLVLDILRVTSRQIIAWKEHNYDQSTHIEISVNTMHSVTLIGNLASLLHMIHFHHRLTAVILAQLRFVLCSLH